MRPFKSSTGLAKWLLRISLIAVIYLSSFDIFLQFSFNSFSYFIHTLLVLFGVLIFIGAFAGRHSLTVISALIICILFFILWYIKGFGSLNTSITYISYICISFFFVANGNK